MTDDDYLIASEGRQPPEAQLRGTPKMNPPVELPVVGAGVVTWDGRMLQIAYAPGLTAQEADLGAERVKAMLEARKRT